MNHQYSKVGEFDQIVRDARQERAVAIGNFIADAFIWLGNLPALVSVLLEPKHGCSLTSCTSAEEVRQYASSIQRTHPSFANDLFAAANRADNER